DIENEKIGYKIRNATLMKVPYLVIIGDKEVSENTVTVRKRSGENIGPFTVTALLGILKEKITTKTLEI
ncbi:MAG: threonine--tRNA ligase, partial [Nitrospirales bacterium]